MDKHKPNAKLTSILHDKQYSIGMMMLMEEKRQISIHLLPQFYLAYVSTWFLTSKQWFFSAESQMTKGSSQEKESILSS